MFRKRLLAVITMAGLAATPVLAQTAVPKTSVAPPMTTTVPAVKAPAVPSAAAPVTAPTNLNTATDKELDALPGIGKSRAKAIIAERTKAKFADWADFDKRMTGTPVNAGVKAKIKPLVTF
jgi:competence protein ComEA